MKIQYKLAPKKTNFIAKQSVLRFSLKFEAMLFPLVVLLCLVPLLSGGPAHSNQNVGDTLKDIASVMRSSMKEENCVCKSPLVSPQTFKVHFFKDS